MADTPNKKPTVASPSSAYLRMAPRWRMIDVLLGGTEARIASGKEFLPSTATSPTRTTSPACSARRCLT